MGFYIATWLHKVYTCVSVGLKVSVVCPSLHSQAPGQSTEGGRLCPSIPGKVGASCAMF